ncbi:MAG: glycosyltransferase family 2 protein [Bacteroidetes bacterium]|nr:glycosyltransferase family 2 protein [Bacteroidota bacterium]
MSDPSTGCVAVVPAFQAASTLPSVLTRLAVHIQPARTLVVDDGSTDDTSGVARAFGVMVVRQEPNRGKGSALRRGMSWWKDRADWEALVTLDADGQHAPEDLPALIAQWSRTGADVVLGSRRFSGVGMPWERQLSNRITSALVSWRTGETIADSQCGLRLHSRRAVELVVTASDGFEAETEFLLRAAELHLRFSSAPIRTIYAGERSSMTYWKTTKAFVRTLFKEV